MKTINPTSFITSHLRSIVINPKIFFVSKHDRKSVNLASTLKCYYIITCMPVVTSYAFVS